MVAERLRVTCEIRGNWICICHSPCDGGDLKPFEIPSRAMDHSANYHPAPNRRRLGIFPEITSCGPWQTQATKPIAKAVE